VRRLAAAFEKAQASLRTPHRPSDPSLARQLLHPMVVVKKAENRSQWYIRDAGPEVQWSVLER
jgi:hypothetical protein